MEVAPPFPPGQQFWCSQGGRSPRGRSHSFSGDLYALDLASPLQRDDVAVVSPVDGTAYVFDGCEERDARPDARNSSRCGLGYGNHVKIWDGTSLHLLGHLARVTVRPGPVRQGDILGVMGCSGAAGERHVHVTVTRSPAAALAEIFATPGWKGQIPVRFKLAARAASDGSRRAEWSDRFPCVEPSDAAPRFVR